jgi:serine/threonine-protein kinase
MEFIDGLDLSRLLRREQKRGQGMSARRFLELARPICEGLEAAHAVGVIHRDLKPHNVVVSDEGRVVLTDFGIARARLGQGRLEQSRLKMDGLKPDSTTQYGVPMGTPAYMSPEQVRGADNVDERSDLYSLGVMFYEMLAGELPFSGEKPVTIALARLLNPAPSLAGARPDLPDALVDLVDTCLAREVGRRIHSVDELLARLDALDMALTGENGPIEVPMTGPLAGRTTSPSSRFRALHRSVVDAHMQAAKTVAVMPFRYQGDDANEYLADGLTEELIDELSLSRDLKVRPRSAVMSHKGSTRSARELGRELSVQVIVDGGIRQIGGRVRVRVAVIGVDDGFQIWAKRFEGTSGDLFDISEEAARAIVEALSADELSARQPAHVEPAAVEAYMQARQLMHASWFGDLTGAIDLFERALKAAPTDPRLLSGCATARARAAFFGGSEAATHLQEATKNAERAISIAPERAEPHLALARVHFTCHEFGRALASLRAALTRSPSSAASHDLLGRILRETGPLEVAVEHMRSALDLDPELHTTRWDLAQASALAGEWATVDELLELSVDHDDHRNARESARTRSDLWRAEPRWLDAGGEPPITPLSPHIRLMSHHRRELMRTGSFSSDYHQLIDEVLAQTGRGTRLDLLIRQVRAENYAAVGEIDEAIAAVEDAVAAGLLDLVWLERCRVFDAARGRAGFNDCVTKVRERVRRISKVARQG